MRIEIPKVMGNEEETGLLIGPVGEPMSEPYDMTSQLKIWVPDDVMPKCDSSHIISTFTTNGFKVYNGNAAGAYEPTNIERATPECTSPRQLVAYIDASDTLIVDMVQQYVAETAYEAGIPYLARIQRRVVDSRGSRKASHDNYSLPSELDPANFDHELLIVHLATRSLVTGAGYVRADGSFRVSQKNGGLEGVRGYGYKGYMYRIDGAAIPNDEEGRSNELRLEVRSGDINLKDWAVQVRVGMTAMVAAMSFIDEAKQLTSKAPRDAADIVLLAKSASRLLVQPDGSLRTSQTDAFMTALDMQQRIAEFAMDSLPFYVDVPSEYFVIAKEQYDYIDELRRCITEGDQVYTLANRADWAAKLMYITAKYERDKKYGIPRKLLDIEAQKQDMYYDYIEVFSDGEDIPNVRRGAGYNLRTRDQTRLQVGPQEKQRACYVAPPDSRASLRAYLLKDHFVTSCDWGRVVVQTPSGKSAIIELSPSQTQFTEEQQELLGGA